MGKFNDEIEKRVNQKIFEDEIGNAKNNKTREIVEFDSYVNLLDSIREPKQYDWMSDIRLPEFVSHVLTQSSMDVNQYFQTREFVEVFLEDEGDEAIAAAEAAKECINRTLNHRKLYHYLKYVRGRIINQLSGRVYAVCSWKQKTEDEVIGQRINKIPAGRNIFGEERFDEIQEDITRKAPLVDRFDYDIVHPANIYMDNSYAYSLQEKDWITIRSEKTTLDLKKDAEANGYFNLDKLEAFVSVGETETSKESYNKSQGSYTPENKEDKPVKVYYDIYERYGGYWCLVNKRDDNDYPIEIEPGIDEHGRVLDKAELIEAIITLAVNDDRKVLIRFQPTPYVDVFGIPYKPIIRGLCYVHPTKDAGMGDGKHSRELQLAIDDSVNVGTDRVLLATLPALKVKRYIAEDNPEIYIAPNHLIPLDDPTKDLEELGISDDIQGSMLQTAMFQKMMQQLNAIYPTTMGDLPGLASTTATAVAGGESKTDLRSNYKSLTFENTFLVELYSMILQMTWGFAFPETGEKLMGDKVFDFDPSLDYFYKPVSQSIESEYSKATKIKNWSMVFQTVASVPHPDIAKPLNYIMRRIFELLGDEYANFSDNMLDPEKELTGGAGSAPGGAEVPPQNQIGLPQGDIEQTLRGG